MPQVFEQGPFFLGYTDTCTLSAAVAALPGGFSLQGGEAFFAPGRGKGTVKLLTEPLKMQFLREF